MSVAETSKKLSVSPAQLYKGRDALGSDPALVRPILEQIGDIYDLESKWSDELYGERQRKDARREHSLPIVASIKGALIEIGSNLSVLPSSPTRKATSYALNRWDALEACFEQGNTHLDTNDFEIVSAATLCYPTLRSQ
jgi:transposase